MCPRINPGNASDPSLRIQSSITPASKVAVAPPVSKPAVIQPADPIAERRIGNADLPGSTEQARGLPSRLIQDVQQIAAKAGFVGLTPSAIQRAYYQGESLFVDVSA